MISRFLRSLNGSYEHSRNSRTSVLPACVADAGMVNDAGMSLVTSIA